MTGKAEVAEFFSTWDVYRAVLDHNAMEHREIGVAERQVLARGNGFSVADLGCRDCSAIAAVLAGLPVTRFVGVDSAAPALELAQQELAGLGADLELTVADLPDYLVAGSERFDVIHICFALHHFDAAGKRDVLAAALDRLADGGEVLLVDVVRRSAMAGCGPGGRGC